MVNLRIANNSVKSCDGQSWVYQSSGLSTSIITLLCFISRLVAIKGWLQTVKLRPLVEIKLARPIRNQYFRFSINNPQDHSFFFLVQKHHVWTVLICFSNLKCGDKSVTVETGDVSWGEGRSYLLFLIVDEWNITWSRPYLITFFVKHCVQIHDSWRFQGILELPMWTT